MGDPEFELDATPTEEAAAVFTEWEDKVIENKSIELLASMYREVYDDVEVRTKELLKLQAKKEALAEQFCKILLAEGLKQVKTEDGSFAPEVKPTCAIVKGMEEKAFQILEEQGLGAIIKRTVNWQTLNKVYRDSDLIIQQDPYLEVFKTWAKHSIRIRRS